MKKSKNLPVYVNPKQVAFLNATQKRRTFQGSRGTGKSTVLGHINKLRFNALPRAKSLIAGLTYNQILSKTLPAAMDAWSMHGLLEYDKDLKYGHYVVGQRPPSDWPKPFQAPRKYENVISFINGFCIEMLSLDRPDTARGGNYDGMDLDESALLKRDVVNKVLLPMVRGNIHRFTDPLHQLVCDYSSAAWLPSGQWIYETEDLAKEFPDEYLHIQSTAFDNIHVLGQRYIDRMQREMSKLEFDVEMLNKRMTRLPNSFYPSLNPDTHCRSNTYNYYYDDATGLTMATTNDVDPTKPLESSFDFNAEFTSMTIHQEHGREFRTVDAIFVKESDQSLVSALVDKFCETYVDHKKKHLIMYGDRNGNNKSPGQTQTFYEQIIKRLDDKGWTADLMPLGLDPDHRLKHLYLNELLSEKNPSWPVIRFNQNKCKYVIMSMQGAPITPEWKKDKSSEKLKIDQERATHLSDCWDNIVYRKYAHLFDQVDTLPDTIAFW